MTDTLQAPKRFQPRPKHLSLRSKPLNATITKIPESEFHGVLYRVHVHYLSPIRGHTSTIKTFKNQREAESFAQSALKNYV